MERYCFASVRETYKYSIGILGVLSQSVGSVERSRSCHSEHLFFRLSVSWTLGEASSAERAT